MRKTLLIICLISIVSITLIVFPAQAGPLDDGSGGNGNTIVYDHWSLLTVEETITDLGGGTWRYSYSFVNTESDYIWLFWLYTTFDVSTPTYFVEKPGWIGQIDDINWVFDIFDARNLDPAITRLIATYPPDALISYTTADPISVGMSVSGLSFQANVYDPSPKYYGYELRGNFGQETGVVSAVGKTGPPPTGVPEFGAGFTIMSSIAAGIWLLLSMFNKRKKEL